MSRSVTLLDLRTRVRFLADVVGDVNVADSAVTSLINRHATELYDRLSDADPDRYAATATLAVLPGTSEYALPANFRNLTDVSVSLPNGRSSPLKPMVPGTRGNYLTPTVAATVSLEYIPTATDLTADSDTLDGVSGWDELIVNLVARDIMVSRQDDPAVVLNNIAMQEARITSRSRGRQRGRARRVTDLDDIDRSAFWYGGGSTNLACYRLRGDNLVLLASNWTRGIP